MIKLSTFGGKVSRTIPGVLTISGCLLTLLLLVPLARAGVEYEVWLSDQANTQGITSATPTGTHGGAIRIYEGADLDQIPPINNPVVLDVTTDLLPNANTTTGAHVSRIHGVSPSPDHVHMALNFVASGHLGIVDGRTKKPVCQFRTTSTATGRQNHMSFWTPDGLHIIVANQNGRILERVDVVRSAQGAAESFTFTMERQVWILPEVQVGFSDSRSVWTPMRPTTFHAQLPVS